MKCKYCRNDLRTISEQVTKKSFFGKISEYQQFIYCDKCGFKELASEEDLVKYNPNFQGVYNYTKSGIKKEVYCPRCNSENCSYFQEQHIIPRKTKTTYSTNINPLKPLTFANKNEKIKQEQYTTSVSKLMCNNCGFIFK